MFGNREPNSQRGPRYQVFWTWASMRSCGMLIGILTSGFLFAQVDGPIDVLSHRQWLPRRAAGGRLRISCEH